MGAGLGFFEILQLTPLSRFDIGPPPLPYGGYRFPNNALMTGGMFAGFHLDVAFGDTWFTPHY